MAGRICAIRKSREAIRIAERKLRKDAQRRSRSVKPTTLEFARYVILFKTFPADRFTASQVLQRHLARWQVELVFKRFKPAARLGHLPKYDDESAKAWLYGKLFVALLTEQLIRHAEAVSPRGYELETQTSAQRLEGIQLHA